MKLSILIVLLSCHGLCLFSQSQEQAYIKRGLDLLDQKQYEQALTLFDYAIEDNPRSAQAYYYKARSKAYLFQYKEALELYNQALRLDNSLADAYFYRALSKQFLKDSSAALNDFYQAIEYDKDDAQKYVSRAESLLFFGQYDKAIEDFHMAIELGENSTWIQLRLAEAYIGQEDYQAALSILRPLKDKLNYDYKYFELSGIAKFRLNDLTPAMRDFHKSVELNSKNYPIYLERADCRGQLGDIKGACKDLKLASKNNIKVPKELMERYCK